MFDQNIQKYLEKMKNIQKELLKLIENEDDIEENYQNFIKLFNDYKTQENKQDIKSLLYLILRISNNHFRGLNFFRKIERIIFFLKQNIKNNFTNYEIFDIFKSNKRILLFLFEEEIIKIDKYIFDQMANLKFRVEMYLQYFSTEINNFIKEQNLQNSIKKEIYQNILKEIPDNFNENRKIGENETNICVLIRNDSISDFITYINRTNISLQSDINLSIFETNSFLIKKQTPTNILEHPHGKVKKKLELIEYAAFYGSIQIFKYLFLNGVKLNPSIWLFAVHSDNEELFHFLEEKKIIPEKKIIENCLKESIKCHHINVTNYIQENFVNKKNQIKIISKNFQNIYSYSFHYYNFVYFPNDLQSEYLFLYACKYDYLLFVEYFINHKQLNYKTSLKEISTLFFHLIELT